MSAKLNLYGPSFEHAPGYIVGNQEALIQLRDTINKVLSGETSFSRSQYFATDGEGYDVFIMHSEKMNYNAFYTDDSYPRPEGNLDLFPWVELDYDMKTGEYIRKEK